MASSLQDFPALDVLELRIWEQYGGDFVDRTSSQRKTRKLAMSEKKTIRIVKKGEKTQPSTKPKAASAREAARDMVGTVTNWVTEFQQKRRNETSSALRILSKTPRGSEA